MRSVKRLVFAATLLCSAPAFAAPLVGPETDTSAVSPGDVVKFDVVAPGMLGPVAIGTDNATLLAGDIGNPGGHIELFGSSEALGNAAYDASSDRTSLRGTLGGNPIVLSSLTAADWATILGTGQTLLRQWLLDAATAHGADLLTPISVLGLGTIVPLDVVEAAFIDAGGRQRFADPNIAYVNQNDVSGDVTIGLSGYLNAHDELFDLLVSTGFAGSLIAAYLPDPIQVSELVKVEYLGSSFYMYSLMAVDSGLTAGDQYNSGSGIFELTLDGLTGLPMTESTGLRSFPVDVVSEPGTLAIVFLGIVGLGMARRRNC